MAKTKVAPKPTTPKPSTQAVQQVFPVPVIYASGTVRKCFELACRPEGVTRSELAAICKSEGKLKRMLYWIGAGERVSESDGGNARVSGKFGWTWGCNREFDPEGRITRIMVKLDSFKQQSASVVERDWSETGVYGANCTVARQMIAAGKIDAATTTTPIAPTIAASTTTTAPKPAEPKPTPKPEPKPKAAAKPKAKK